MKHQNPDCTYVEIGEWNCPKCFDDTPSKNKHAVALGRLGGKVKSPKKALSSRKNGMKATEKRDSSPRLS